MRMLLAVFCAFVLLTSANAAVNVQTLKTPGGLEVWFVEQRGLPIVNVEAAFNGGRSLETPDKAGLARLMSYLMDEGAGQMDAQTFMAALSDRAINFSMAAEAERMMLSMSFLKEHAADAAKLGAMALTKPRFDAAPVRRMKDAILVEQAQIEDDPASKADLEWWRLAFAGTSYGVGAAGAPQTVAPLSQKDLREFHVKALTRANLLTVIVGDLSAAEAGALADELFGGLPMGAPLKDMGPVSLKRTGVSLIDRDVPQSVIIFGMPAVTRDDPDFRALHTLNYMLGGGSFASRLMQEVRVKRGLVYGVSTSLTTFDRTGVVYGSLATKNETADEALEVVKAEIKRLRDEGPSEQELADAKAYLTGSWPLAFDSNASIATQLLAFRIYGKPPNYGELRNPEVEALTVENLREVARKHLDPDRIFVVALGKPKGLTAK
jgi:zinc protease